MYHSVVNSATSAMLYSVLSSILCSVLNSPHQHCMDGDVEPLWGRSLNMFSFAKVSHMQGCSDAPFLSSLYTHNGSRQRLLSVLCYAVDSIFVSRIVFLNRAVLIMLTTKHNPVLLSSPPYNSSRHTFC